MNEDVPFNMSDFFTVVSGTEKDEDETDWLLLEEINKNWPNPWRSLSSLAELVEKIVNKSKRIKQSHISRKNYKLEGNVHFQNDEHIYIGEGTMIKHGAYIKGPCIIGEKCQLRVGSFIRENAIIGNGCLIGNSCEIKNSILFSNCQIAHFNYIGDSILGRKAHFSAGAITSNLKLDSSQIKIKIKKSDNNHETVKTGAIKFGGIFGENCEIGCNAVCNPGSLVCKNSVIYPLVNFRGFLAAGKICKPNQKQIIVDKEEKKTLT